MAEAYITHGLDELITSFAALGDELNKIFRKVGKTAERDMLRAFRRTVKSWRRRPAFASILDFDDEGFAVIAGTDNDVYHIVNAGARKHPIFPRGPWPLRFVWGGFGSYKAKTAPGVLDSWPGGPRGHEVRRAFVKHPGLEARNFTGTIESEIGEKSYNQMLDLLGEALRKAERRAQWGGA